MVLTSTLGTSPHRLQHILADGKTDPKESIADMHATRSRIVLRTSGQAYGTWDFCHARGCHVRALCKLAVACCSALLFKKTKRPK